MTVSLTDKLRTQHTCAPFARQFFLSCSRNCMSHARFQTSAALYIRSSVFWDVMQRIIVSGYRRFGDNLSVPFSRTKQSLDPSEPDLQTVTKQPSIPINRRFVTSQKNEDLCRRLRLKRDGTRAETRFRLSPKRTSPFKSAGGRGKGGVSPVDCWQPRCVHFFFSWRYNPRWGLYFTALQWVLASSLAKFLDHTQRRATFGRTPLNEWSVCRRDLYLTTHNTHNRQISMPRVRHSGSLRSEWWQFLTDVSGQPISSTSRDLEDGTDRLCRNVGENLPLLAA